MSEMSKSVSMMLDHIRYLARQMAQTSDSRRLLELSRELRRTATNLQQCVGQERAAQTAAEGGQG